MLSGFPATRGEHALAWVSLCSELTGKLRRAVRKGALGFVLVYENHLLYKYYLSGAEILFLKN
jgi:hypothetical protein